MDRCLVAPHDLHRQRLLHPDDHGPLRAAGEAARQLQRPRPEVPLQLRQPHYPLPLAGHVWGRRLGRYGGPVDRGGGRLDGHPLRVLHRLRLAGPDERGHGCLRPDGLAERQGRRGLLLGRPGAQALQQGGGKQHGHDHARPDRGALGGPVQRGGVEVHQRSARGGAILVQLVGHRGDGGSLVPGVPQWLFEAARAQQVHGCPHHHAGGAELVAAVAPDVAAVGRVPTQHPDHSRGPLGRRQGLLEPHGAARHEHRHVR
mmetsp:Transcript_53922/g.167113  ORF Transcript_53922/g.167113 Transcript_53922/m.167113 type:complete len:259 (-) Transcript_53922:440-1216(-)